MNSETIIERDGYLVDGETGEKIVWYECDPSKNSECDKVLCRSAYVDQEHNFGFCAKTADPRFRKDRGRAWYAVKRLRLTAESRIGAVSTLRRGRYDGSRVHPVC